MPKPTTPSDPPESLPYAVYETRNDAPVHLHTLEDARLTVDQINSLSRLAWELREERVIEDTVNAISGELVPGGTIPVLAWGQAREEFKRAHEKRRTLWARLTDAELAARAQSDGAVN